jgi:site-specific recombinase XerD
VRRAGGDLDVVKQLLGHAHISMTERYAHVGREQLHAAVGRIGGSARLPKIARARPQ